MKIIQVIMSLANGGAEKFVVELINEQSKNNEIILCSVKNVEDWMIPPKNLKPRARLIELQKK